MKNILVSTFPIYQIVRNITQDSPHLKVQLMIPSQMGCPHDYALTPQDMKKLVKANALIINGLGLEEFLGAPIKKENPNIHIIDSSAGIKETLEFSKEEDHDEHHDDHGKHDKDHDDHDKHDKDHDDHEKGHDKHGKEHDEHDDEHDKHGKDHDDHEKDHDKHGDHDDHDHHHEGTNPHLFASPRMTAKLAMNLAAELSKIDPAGAGTYFKNAQSYAKKMNQLADDMSALGKRLKNKKIVQPHGIFDYLARDIGLEIVAVLTAHGAEPSASEMAQLVKVIKKEKAGAIYTEPQYSAKVGKTLARETGVKLAELDPVATGPKNAPMNYFEKVMRKNMDVLQKTLGTK